MMLFYDKDDSCNEEDDEDDSFHEDDCEDDSCHEDDDEVDDKDDSWPMMIKMLIIMKLIFQVRAHGPISGVLLHAHLPPDR